MRLLGLAVLAVLAMSSAEDLDQETAETEFQDHALFDHGHEQQGGGHGYGFAIHTEHSEQYAERDDASGGGLRGFGLHEEAHHLEPSESKQHQYVKRIVLTKAVPYSVPQPYPVTVEKRVPYAVKVPVQVPVDKPYEITVLKPYAVPVDRPVHYAVEKPVPYPVKVAVKVPVPQPVPYEVAKPYSVPVAVPKPYRVAIPVYIRAKEHGVKSDFPHVRYIPKQFEPQPQPVPQPIPHQPIPQPVPQPIPHQPIPQPIPHQPIPQPLPQPIPHQPDLGAGAAGGQGDDHFGGYSEQKETYAVSAASSSALDARLADLMQKGGSYSYVYRN